MLDIEVVNFDNYRLFVDTNSVLRHLICVY